MLVCWISDIMSYFNTANRNEVIWYIFDVITLLQGVFLSLANVPNKDFLKEEDEVTQNGSQAEDNENGHETNQPKDVEIVDGLSLQVTQETEDNGSFIRVSNNGTHL